MKIAVNAATLRGLGSRSVGQGLIKALAHAEGVDTLDIWVPRQWVWANSDGQLAHAEWHEVSQGAVRKIWTENTSMRFSLRRRKVTRLLSLGDTSIPRPGVPHLLFVQQAFLAYPYRDLGFHLPWAFAQKLRIMHWYFKMGLGGVSEFCVQTESMRARLCDKWNLPVERVWVLPTPAEALSEVTTRADSPDATPSVCCISSPGPHKNLNVLVDMLEELKHRGINLICRITIERAHAPALVRLAETRGVLDRLEFVGALDRHRLAQLVADSIAVILPSKLESFGLPYYEAMSVGSSIVAADRDFAREACGDAALYPAADTGEAFADQVESLLASTDLRIELARLGRQRFAAVNQTWTSTAAAYVSILKALA